MMNSTNHTLDHHDDDHGSHSQPTVILFIFACCAMGAIVRTLLKKVPIGLPYTALLLVIGVLFGLLSRNVPEVQAYTTLANADPHIILHTFLPVLIFESAFAMESHTFLKSFLQIVTLALPGLMLASFLTAVFAMNVFSSYTWGWAEGMMFGSIISATDPVAVVALLKDLGASKQLGVLIEGESLLNDGAAIVVFNVFLQMVMGVQMTISQVFVYFIQVALGGPAFGFVMAKITTFWLSRIFNDALTEITITLAATYVTFYIGEAVLKVSGVLAVVVLGVVLNSEKTSISPEVEAFLHRFWEMLAYLANTLIFIIVGVVITERAMDGVEGTDWFFMIALYCAITIIRGSIIALFSPVLKRMGYGLTWRNGTVMCWGGLRGAVGLALALLVAQATRDDVTMKVRIGDKMLFHTAGIVVLTLLVNATTISSLLKILGMSDISAPKRMAMASAVRTLRHWGSKSLSMLKTDRFLADADWELVESLCQIEDPYNTLDEEAELDTLTYLNRTSTCPCCDTAVPNEPSPKELREMHNEARQRVIKAQKISFWKQFEHGMLSREAVRKLVDCAEVAADTQSDFINVEEVQKSWQIKGIYDYMKAKLTKWIMGGEEKYTLKGNVTQFRLKMFKLVNTPLFEYCVYVMIFVNLIPIMWEVTLAYGEEDIRPDFELGFMISNYTFIVLYIIEAFCKMVAYKLTYFKSYWNLFDFIIIALSLVDMILDWTIFRASDTAFNPTIFRILKIFRVARLIRGLRLFRALLPQFMAFLNGRINKQLRFGYDVGKGFVLAGEEVETYIEQMVDNEKIAKELTSVLEENRLLVIKGLGLLQKAHPGTAVSVKTQQAARRILNNMRDKTIELRGEGVVDEAEAHKLEIMVEMRMKRLLAVPATIAPPPPESVISNIPWVDGSEEIIDFIKERALFEVYESGKVIPMDKDNSGLYIIVSGMIKIKERLQDNTQYKKSHSLDSKVSLLGLSSWVGQDIITDYLTTGNVIGELALLTGQQGVSVVTCETAVQIYHIIHEDMKIALDLFTEEPSLEYRMWHMCGNKLSTNILMNQTYYNTWSQDRVKLYLENSFIPKVKKQKNYVINRNLIQDIILINGNALHGQTREEFFGPCYIPRNCDRLMLIVDTNPVLLAVPTATAAKQQKEEETLHPHAHTHHEAPEPTGKSGSSMCLQHATTARNDLEHKIEELKEEARHHSSSGSSTSLNIRKSMTTAFRRSSGVATVRSGLRLLPHRPSVHNVVEPPNPNLNIDAPTVYKGPTPIEEPDKRAQFPPV